MEDRYKINSGDIKELTIEIQKCFSSKTVDKDDKWLLLKNYYSNFLKTGEFDKILTTSYITVLSTLLDGLKPDLFTEKWQETLYDDVFIYGIHHESFLILVKRLEQSEKFVVQKVMNLLLKFTKSSSFEYLFIYQCVNHKDWNLKYVSKSNFWDDLINAVISLPERIANKTGGQFKKIFRPAYFMSILFDTVLKVLNVIHNWLKDSQDCSIEFLSKLTGKICTIGHADIVAKKFSRELIKVSRSDFIWRRISQNFITKMPSCSLDSFIPNLLNNIPWYVYVEWILGDEGVKNEKINYLMTVKLLFFRSFEKVILQNTIGYFASSHSRVSYFINILNSLLDYWMDTRALKHQTASQKIYMASALMVCAGWLKQLKIELDKKEFLNKVIQGTQIRLECSKETDRSLGMIVGENLIKSIDPDSPPLKYEHNDLDLVNHLKQMLEIPSNPVDISFPDGDLKCFEETEPESINEKKGEGNENCDISTLNEELESDDEIEPFDMSHDVPQSELKRPLYLRDCMMGLVEQENVEWAEKCMKHAEELIKANPYAAEEVAEEMTKIVLHLRDSSAIDDFVVLRHRILIALTIQCPIIVSNYLISQFSEKEYTIRQRLDVLEVLAASSALLSNEILPASETQPTISKQDFVKKEVNWKIIIEQRLQAKTKRYTKAQAPKITENKFSAIAGNFFYPLLNSYERSSKVLKLHLNDSYVLGRFIYTLGIIICCSSNALHCGQMGATLLEFLSSQRYHEDVFVRESIIFAVAATYTAVPSSILFSNMLQDVTETTEWLQNVAENDSDSNCVEKALYALSIFQSAASEGSLLYQLRSLTIS